MYRSNEDLLEIGENATELAWKTTFDKDIMG
jgi:hypothetical protein